MKEDEKRETKKAGPGENPRELKNIMMQARSSITINSRIFIFLPIRAASAFALPTSGRPCGDHRPLPSFSFSAYGDDCEWNLGRLLDMRRMCRVKKPWFCVEKDG
jgi:hypothetical protein